MGVPCSGGVFCGCRGHPWDPHLHAGVSRVGCQPQHMAWELPYAAGDILGSPNFWGAQSWAEGSNLNKAGGPHGAEQPEVGGAGGCRRGRGRGQGCARDKAALPVGSRGSSLPLNIVIDERENRLLQQSGIISRFWALIRGSLAPWERSRRGAAGESSPLRSSFSPPDELIKQLVPDEAAARSGSATQSRLRFGLAAGASRSASRSPGTTGPCRGGSAEGGSAEGDSRSRQPPSPSPGTAGDSSRSSRP